MTKRKEELREFVVYGTVELRGAYMVVLAIDEADAMAKADAEPDYDTSGAETINWKAESAQPNE